MACVSVDSNGRRIKTDILVMGYIRDIMDQNKLDIPDEIIALCFLFWFINVCDEWDKTLCHEEYVDIEGSCARINTEIEITGASVTMFGAQTVESGIFKWRLKLNTKMDWGCIGIIKDEKSYIEQNHTNNDYGRGIGCGCFLFICKGGGNGALFHSNQLDLKYSDPCRDEGTVFEMTLNMDQYSIQYKVNDKEYESVNIDSLSNHRYRLAVTLSKTDDDGIELL